MNPVWYVEIDSWASHWSGASVRPVTSTVLSCCCQDRDEWEVARALHGDPDGVEHQHEQRDRLVDWTQERVERPSRHDEQEGRCARCDQAEPEGRLIPSERPVERCVTQPDVPAPLVGLLTGPHCFDQFAEVALDHLWLDLQTDGQFVLLLEEVTRQESTMVPSGCAAPVISEPSAPWHCREGVCSPASTYCIGTCDRRIRSGRPARGSVVITS